MRNIAVRLRCAIKSLKNIEGKNILVSYKGELQFVLTELQEYIQSGIFYGGGKVLADLRKVKYEFLHR